MLMFVVVEHSMSAVKGSEDKAYLFFSYTKANWVIQQYEFPKKTELIGSQSNQAMHIQELLAKENSSFANTIFSPQPH